MKKKEEEKGRGKKTRKKEEVKNEEKRKRKRRKKKREEKEGKNEEEKKEKEERKRRRREEGRTKNKKRQKEKREEKTDEKRRDKKENEGQNTKRERWFGIVIAPTFTKKHTHKNIGTYFCILVKRTFLRSKLSLAPVRRAPPGSLNAPATRPGPFGTLRHPRRGARTTLTLPSLIAAVLTRFISCFFCFVGMENVCVCYGGTRKRLRKS